LSGAPLIAIDTSMKAMEMDGITGGSRLLRRGGIFNGAPHPQQNQFMGGTVTFTKLE
jgi:hypothetical protein